MELQSLVPAGHAKDTQIVAVSPDPVDQFKKMGAIVLGRTGREFAGVLLSDSDHRVIDRYGLRNEDWEGDVVPHPTTYVIDPAGKVRWKFTEKNFAVRPSNDMILGELKKLWAGK